MVKSQIQGAIPWGTCAQTGCAQGSRRSKARLPLASQKVFDCQQVFLANRCAALLLPFHHAKCWVCRVFWAVLAMGEQGLPTMHVVLIAFCGDNTKPQLPLDEMIQSTGVLGTAASAGMPAVGLNDVNKKLTKTRRNLKVPCCFCCRFSYQRGKHAGFVVHGSALIYTDVPLFKEEILGYSDLRSAPGSRSELF